MPEIVFPTSDIGRLALLERIHQTIIGQLAGDAEQKEMAAFFQTLADELADFLALYEPAVKAVQAALGNRARGTKERRQATERLGWFVRDFFVVLKRRMRRNGEPADLWHTYGMQSDGTLPDPKTPDELLQWGKRIVDGDVEAVKAGYLKMINPTAKQVLTALENARSKMSDVPQADIAYNRAQAAVQALRAQADSFIRRSNMLLEYLLHGHTKSDIRRIKRDFGFVFRYQTGEARDPDDLVELAAPDDDLPTDLDELTPIE